jgi:hypothetical protein
MQEQGRGSDAFEQLHEQHPQWTGHAGNAFSEAMGWQMWSETAAAEAGDTGAIDRLLLRHHGMIN